MSYSTCIHNAREYIKADAKQRLLSQSRFSCSICGKIPVVFHHIEEWSKKFSNDERYLIPICDECHRRIHGRGGCFFSKKELYKYKARPAKPLVLVDKFPLERKRGYSFFIGSSFVSHGERTSLFNLSGRHSLLSVDLSSGILKLSILARVQNDNPVYLVKDNELRIDTQHIWKMDYSGNALKIWGKSDGKRVVFIDLIIKPEVILIREMTTEFNGKKFRIYKLRAPQKRQRDKLDRLVKLCERYYLKGLAEIEKQPRIAPIFNNIDLDKLIKDTRKNSLKHEIELRLRETVFKEFKWDWYYTEFVLESVLSKSSVFRKPGRSPSSSSRMLIKISKMIDTLKKKYKQEFREVENVIVKYNGMILMNNIAL